MSIGVAVKAAAIATVRALGTLAAGAYLGRRTIPDPAVWKGVNKLMGEFLVPCLCLASLSKAVTTDTLGEAGALILMFIINTVIGLVSGGLLAHLPCAHVPRDLTAVAVVCTTFSNVVAIPVPVFLALADELEWLDNDDVRDRGVAYCYLYGAASLMLLWSYGYWLLVRYRGKVDAAEEAAAAAAAAAAVSPRVADSQPHAAAPAGSNGARGGAPRAEAEGPHGNEVRCKHRSAAGAPGEDDNDVELGVVKPPPPPLSSPSAVLAEQPIAPGAPPPPTLCGSAALHAWWTGDSSAWINPITVSCLVAVCVGLATPVRELWVGSFAWHATKYVGDCAPPLCLLAMGAAMGQRKSSAKKEVKGEGGDVVNAEGVVHASPTTALELRHRQSGHHGGGGWAEAGEQRQRELEQGENDPRSPTSPSTPLPRRAGEICMMQKGVRKSEATVRDAAPGGGGDRPAGGVVVTNRHITTIAVTKLVIVTAVQFALSFMCVEFGIIRTRVMHLVLILFSMSPMAANVAIAASRAGAFVPEVSRVAFVQQTMTLVTFPIVLSAAVVLLQRKEYPDDATIGNATATVAVG